MAGSAEEPANLPSAPAAAIRQRTPVHHAGDPAEVVAAAANRRRPPGARCRQRPSRRGRARSADLSIRIDPIRAEMGARARIATATISSPAASSSATRWRNSGHSSPSSIRDADPHRGRCSSASAARGTSCVRGMALAVRASRRILLARPRVQVLARVARQLRRPGQARRRGGRRPRRRCRCGAAAPSRAGARRPSPGPLRDHGDRPVAGEKDQPGTRAAASSTRQQCGSAGPSSVAAHSGRWSPSAGHARRGPVLRESPRARARSRWRRPTLAAEPHHVVRPNIVFLVSLGRAEGHPQPIGFGIEAAAPEALALRRRQGPGSLPPPANRPPEPRRSLRNTTR